MAIVTPVIAFAQSVPSPADQAATDALYTKMVKECVDVVHKSPADPVYGADSNRKFDAYYNPSDHKIYNNAFLNTAQMALYLFNKCISEKSSPVPSK